MKKLAGLSFRNYRFNVDNLPRLVNVLIIVTVLGTNFYNAEWEKENRVIASDVIT